MFKIAFQPQLLYLLALQVGAHIDDVADQVPPGVGVRPPHPPHVPEHPGHADQLLCVLLLRVHCQAEQHLDRQTLYSFYTCLESHCQAQHNQIHSHPLTLNLTVAVRREL